jgi:hypothetical protein
MTKYSVRCDKCSASYTQTGLAPKRCGACGSEALAVEVTSTARAMKPTFKVSPKGAVSVYGLQRWPTTLYAGQWLALLAEAPALAGFIEANRAKLEWKGENATA